ncbi:hypothetical protein ACFOOK_23820 [Micromonospora krabiensis]|uniref:AP2/ERF domain-containing protein n=1 Tax=Micromonospora krabiensis TaxID=307121 RepID=A0A1C3N742_9ACTN|nr:hypothetical protein [Micromonospora krabiensis]SBV28404.1 hypothetical protein GA0070620_3947 [Micromonospora krabiensis]
MMQTVLSAVLPDVPRAAVIWLSLLAVVVVTIAALLLRPGRLGSDAGARIRRAAMPSQLEFAEEERERTRYAQEVAVAAERATATAQRRRTEWLAAQEEAETAWRVYEAAEADVRRLAAAAAMPLPTSGRSPAEYAERERYLHRAALDAYWRRELSVEQLSDVFAHRGGWDPRRHPVEQELFLRRAVRDNLFARQQAAREREQAAWRSAELAVASARSLREEAFAATGRRVEESSGVLPLGEIARPVEQPTRENPTVARGRAAVLAH